MLDLDINEARLKPAGCYVLGHEYGIEIYGVVNKNDDDYILWSWYHSNEEVRIHTSMIYHSKRVGDYFRARNMRIRLNNCMRHIYN